MKIQPVLCLCLAMLPGVVLGNAPVSGTALGQVEAILSLCTKVEPALEKQEPKILTALMGNVSAQDLASARSSGQYREAYDSISALLTKLDKAHLLAACKDIQRNAKTDKGHDGEHR